jgi:hypothetical protein
MGIEGGVTVRMASLCLDDDGRLRDYLIWDTAARGALLIDLAVAGRLTETHDSVDIDPTPTGFGPADSLLAAITVEPERSLDWWIQSRGVRMSDAAAAIVGNGRWTEHRHLGWAPETAAVIAVTTAAGEPGHRPQRPGDAVLDLTGPLEWICRTVVKQLGVAQLRNKTAALAEGGGVF